MPKKLKRITLIKSPMAHKKFSQEQFSFINYTSNISYKIKIKENYILSEALKALIFIYKCKKYSLNYIDSNLFILKKFKYKLNYSNLTYFKLF